MNVVLVFLHFYIYCSKGIEDGKIVKKESNKLKEKQD
jgi:hypothetical protein